MNSAVPFDRRQHQADIPAPQRRRFLAGLGATIVATAAPACCAEAQQVRAGGVPGENLIDVHHHLMLPQFVTTQRTLLRKVGADGGNVLDWKPSWSIETMDRNGVSAAILSISTPGSWTGDIHESRRLARAINEYSAELVRDHPGRFGFFATLPLPDTDGSLAELAYALDVLKADGVGVLTSYDMKWQGDPAFAPVFDELNRRKTIVYSHPTVADCCVNMMSGFAPATLEFMFDNARAIASHLHNGTFLRCPDIGFIFSHGGGALPMVAGRLSGNVAAARVAAGNPKNPMEELRKLNFDIASMANPISLAALLKFVPASQVLFGSDYPYVPLEATINGLRVSDLTAADSQAIRRGNAQRLLPRLRA